MDEYYFQTHPEAEIDLHGLSRDDALFELARYIVWAKGEHFQYIRIITGKGLGSEYNTPVVRNAVIAYLNTHGYEYEFAHMFSGGEGALHVRL